MAFGRYVHETGLAIPLVLLLFGSVWMFPLITALVAGDIVAAEDRHGTLKTILTRSVERAADLRRQGPGHRQLRDPGDRLDGAVALVAGILASGFNPITSLSGTRVSATQASAWCGPACSSTCSRSSRSPASACCSRRVFRNSGAAIVGTLMFSLLVQLIGILPGLAAFIRTC